MAKELVFRLSNPGYTIYHRAALGGLAATIRAWGENPPLGITASYDKDSAKLAWGDDLKDQEALQLILQASFKLTEKQMIDLPGQGIAADQDDLRLAIHNGICGTFLQHPKMRLGPKGTLLLEIKSADDEVAEMMSYKPVNSYAHQKAQKTELLEAKFKGEFPTVATIPQSLIPGAMSGVSELESSAEEAILLLFLMVGSSIFLLRPRTYQEKAQYCVVIPDVINLKNYAQALRRIAGSGKEIKRFSQNYLGRVVGGAEEAALRFLIDIKADDIASERSVAGCLAVAMGKVSWDKNQINRSFIIRLKGDYPELDVFRAANDKLGKSKLLKTKKGEGFAIPASPVPELIAANLAAERHWCANFKTLVSDKKDFTNILYSKGGLNAMKESIKDKEDQAIIHGFQEAWKITMKNLYDRAKRDGLDDGRLIEVERERSRNAILRAKTSEALASWFLRFCADATKGNSLRTLSKESDLIRKFIFNDRNFDRFQNLCLFALVSYASEAKSTTGGQE